MKWNRGWLLLALAALAAVSLFACAGDDDDDSGDDDTDDDDDDDDTGDDDSGEELPGPANLTPPPWPEWALRHWVWEDESTQESALGIVGGYLEHDIPVGAIIIDSPWATGYSTFEFDPRKFPDAQQMIDDLHEDGVRVMLWTVPNINLDSPNYDYAYEQGYFVNDGRTADWWKGPGSFIDYTNPAALDYWHSLIDNVLEMGVDGWKCDGTVLYMALWFGIDAYAGTLTVPEYQALYYRDFFEYSREVLGPDRVITARPVDSYGLPLHIPTFAPVDTNFVGWVGDQDPTWFGLKAAMRNMFSSAEYGYVYFGSDIGAYRSDDTRDTEVFVRWAQMGAFSGVMENGGGGEHRPWVYGEEVLSIYRRFAKIHHALIPYLYSEGAELYPLGISVQRPTDASAFEYLLGRDLFVAAMVKPGDVRTVAYPEAETWIDFWDGTRIEGGTTATITVPLATLPVYARAGAVIPLDLREGSVFDEADAASPPLTVRVYPKPGVSVTRNVFEESGTGQTIVADYGETETTLSLSATERGYAFAIIGAGEPSSVDVRPRGALGRVDDLDALRAAESGWTVDADATLWIKPGSAENGLIVTIGF